MSARLPTALLLSFLSVACSSAPPYAAQAIEDDAEAMSNVVVADAELHDVVRVGRAGVDRVPGTNQMKVVVPIRNIDDEPIQVLVQVSFQDGRKMPIGDETNDQVQLIAPGQTITHQAISKSAEAQDWVMRIRWNR